jgi:uncharacterized protein (DUF1697 family)
MTQAKTLITHVALLRGINVGGKNRLSMKDLVEMFAAAGCLDVRTYIQSGNIIFRAPQAKADKVPVLISKSIADKFGHRIPVVMRTAAQLQDALHNNPFLLAGGSAELLHLLFLADKPDAERVAGLDSARSAPDAFVVREREIYLQLPNGAGSSKLTNAYFDSKLATISTGRNWRTVLKLHELMQG